MTEPTLPEKILAIHACLTDSKTPHAFGGALALAYYAEPRATIDIDLNVFIPTSQYARLHASLRPLGITADVDLDRLEHEGQCRIRWNATPLDLFFAYDEIHDAMKNAVRQVPFGEDRLPIIAPEHLVVCKTIFNRPKNWLDIEQILVCTEPLDITEIQRWLKRIVGEDDPRKEQFDRLALKNQ